MDDRTLVEQVVRLAFLLRLASLLLVVFTPSTVVRSPVGLAAIGFITITSALGLYGTHYFTERVAAHPLVLVVDVLAAAAIAAVIGAQSPLTLYSLSTAVLVGILLAPRNAVLVVSILIAAFALVVIADSQDVVVSAALVLPLSYATLCAMGSITRTLHEAAMREQLAARRLTEVAARERERARLARDMHDSVAKSLHGIGLAAAALPMWAERDPSQLPARAKELQTAAESASQDARSILVGLRSDTDDRTLAQQLRGLADDLSAGGIPTALSIAGVADCDHAIKREIVAIAEESVENIRRHSRARSAQIECTGSESDLTVRIGDDGVGFDLDHSTDGHFGVVGMQERAESIGGGLALTSAPGHGTTVEVRAPRAESRRST